MGIWSNNRANRATFEARYPTITFDNTWGVDGRRVTDDYANQYLNMVPPWSYVNGYNRYQVTGVTTGQAVYGGGELKGDITLGEDGMASLNYNPLHARRLVSTGKDTVMIDPFKVGGLPYGRVGRGGIAYTGDPNAWQEILNWGTDILWRYGNYGAPLLRGGYAPHSHAQQVNWYYFAERVILTNNSYFPVRVQLGLQNWHAYGGWFPTTPTVIYDVTLPARGEYGEASYWYQGDMRITAKVMTADGNVDFRVEGGWKPPHVDYGSLTTGCQGASQSPSATPGQWKTYWVANDGYYYFSPWNHTTIRNMKTSNSSPTTEQWCEWGVKKRQADGSFRFYCYDNRRLGPGEIYNPHYTPEARVPGIKCGDFYAFRSNSGQPMGIMTMFSTEVDGRGRCVAGTYLPWDGTHYQLPENNRVYVYGEQKYYGPTPGPAVEL